MTAFVHSQEYIRLRRAGDIEKRPDGRYYLRDGRPVTVNDGVPPEGIHEVEPEQKHNVKGDVLPFLP